MKKGTIINPMDKFPVVDFELPSGNRIYIGINDDTFISLISRCEGFAIRRGNGKERD
jgi:hypothetical protein